MKEYMLKNEDNSKKVYLHLASHHYIYIYIIRIIVIRVINYEESVDCGLKVDSFNDPLFKQELTCRVVFILIYCL